MCLPIHNKHIVHIVNTLDQQKNNLPEAGERCFFNNMWYNDNLQSPLLQLKTKEAKRLTLSHRTETRTNRRKKHFSFTHCGWESTITKASAYGQIFLTFCPLSTSTFFDPITFFCFYKSSLLCFPQSFLMQKQKGFWIQTCSKVCSCHKE